MLPKLHSIYCQILRSTDPSRAAHGTRTILSPLVKQNRSALCALGSILEHVINFCDVDVEEVVENLKPFVLSSIAVLLASDIQSAKNVICINSSMYALDDVTRKASWALSNILLTFPRLASVASVLITKRFNSTMKLLCDPFELTVQRSMIVVLKVLYEQKSKSAPEDSTSVKQVIEKEIKMAFPGSLKARTIFKRMKLRDEMFKEVDIVLQHLNNSIDLDKRGVTTDRCAVQVKCADDESRRTAFRKASVDWNLNCMMVKFDNDSTMHWPYFAVEAFEWRRRRKDIWMKCFGWEDRKAADIVVRFENVVLDDSVKDSIETRIQNVLNLMKLEDRKIGFSQPNLQVPNNLGAENVRRTFKLSKVSQDGSVSDDKGLKAETLSTHAPRTGVLDTSQINLPKVIKRDASEDSTDLCAQNSGDDGNDCIDENDATTRIEVIERDLPHANLKETIIGDIMLFHGDEMERFGSNGSNCTSLVGKGNETRLVSEKSNHCKGSRDGSNNVNNCDQKEDDDVAGNSKGKKERPELKKRCQLTNNPNPEKFETIIISDDDCNSIICGSHVGKQLENDLEYVRNGKNPDESNVMKGSFLVEELSLKTDPDMREATVQDLVIKTGRVRRGTSNVRQKDAGGSGIIVNCNAEQNMTFDGKDEVNIDFKHPDGQNDEKVDSSDDDYTPDEGNELNDDFQDIDAMRTEAVLNPGGQRKQVYGKNNGMNAKTKGARAAKLELESLIRERKGGRDKLIGMDGETRIDNSSNVREVCVEKPSDDKIASTDGKWSIEDEDKGSDGNTSLLKPDSHELKKASCYGIRTDRDDIADLNGAIGNHEGFDFNIGDETDDFMYRLANNFAADDTLDLNDTVGHITSTGKDTLSKVAHDTAEENIIEVVDPNFDKSRREKGVRDKDTADTIIYCDMKQQFGSLVENLNEVSFVVP